MPKFNPPEPLDFNRPEEWPMWKQRFERFRLCTKLNAETEAIQVSSLIYAMGSEAERIFSTFTFPEREEGQPDPRENYDDVMT